MKKVAFGLYVAVVLLFSGLARAEAAQNFNPIIRNVMVAENVLALQINGVLPNPMTEQPVARLVQDLEDPSILILVLTAKHYEGISIAPVQNYSVTVSLPQLARDAGLEVTEKAIYILKVKGHDFQLQFSGSDLMTMFPLPVPQHASMI